jgi:hypothetical protein
MRPNQWEIRVRVVESTFERLAVDPPPLTSGVATAAGLGHDAFVHVLVTRFALGEREVHELHHVRIARSPNGLVTLCAPDLAMAPTEFVA